jgi:DivIVA domain-containing protein
MDQDDPEKRVAELEGQLAEHRPMVEPDRREAESVNGPAMTPEQVRAVAFAKPPMGRRGYDEPEVDAFLNHVEIELTRHARQQPMAPPVQGAWEGWRPPAGATWLRGRPWAVLRIQSARRYRRSRACALCTDPLAAPMVGLLLLVLLVVAAVLYVINWVRKARRRVRRAGWTAGRHDREGGAL